MRYLLFVRPEFCRQVCQCHLGKNANISTKYLGQDIVCRYLLSA